MKTRLNREQMARIAFVLLSLACITPLVLRSLHSDAGPSVEIVDGAGNVRMVSLEEMKTMTILTRTGSYQNQYGNWRGEGVYSGVLLTDLIGRQTIQSLEIVALDGYRTTVERWRVEDPDYPMVLAFSMDGMEVPAWEDGFRIVVLPEDGRVSNAEYGATSAGSFWVMQVIRLMLNP